jgi:hypothetical protein
MGSSREVADGGRRSSGAGGRAVPGLVNGVFTAEIPVR